MGSLSFYSVYTSLALIIYSNIQDRWLRIRGEMRHFEKNTISNQNYFNHKRYTMKVRYCFYTPEGGTGMSEKISIYEHVSKFFTSYSFYEIHKIENLYKKKKIDVFYHPLTGKTIILKIKPHKVIILGLLPALVMPCFILYFLKLTGFNLAMYLFSILVTGLFLILLDR